MTSHDRGREHEPVQRVSVVGCPGSGKSTFATVLAAQLGVESLELDGVFHQPQWTPKPADEFRAEVQRFVAEPAWVVDGNYGDVQPLVWERADTVVWLDPPRADVLRRIVPRTVRRVLTRQELWNGNRERWSNLTSPDPQRSIIAYAMRQHPLYRVRYGTAMADPGPTHLTWYRLATPGAVGAFLGST